MAFSAARRRKDVCSWMLLASASTAASTEERVFIHCTGVCDGDMVTQPSTASTRAPSNSSWLLKTRVSPVQGIEICDDDRSEQRIDRRERSSVEVLLDDQLKRNSILRAPKIMRTCSCKALILRTCSFLQCMSSVDHKRNERKSVCKLSSH